MSTGRKNKKAKPPMCVTVEVAEGEPTRAEREAMERAGYEHALAYMRSVGGAAGTTITGTEG